jgi:hypothetical protein
MNRFIENETPQGRSCVVFETDVNAVTNFVGNAMELSTNVLARASENDRTYGK